MLFNMVAVIVFQVSSLFMGLFARQAFLAYLPIGLLGVSDLFNSFFYALGLVDIGFATFLMLSLYKPINEDDHEATLKYIAIFRKIYLFIAVVIAVLSLCAMPFLYKLFKIEYDNVAVVYAIYIIQLITNVTKYFFLHKSNILQLYQKAYIVTYMTMIGDWLCFVAKMISIIVFKNYLLYLSSIMLEGILLGMCNIMITHKHYPYLKKLPKVTIKDIFECDTLKKAKNFMYNTVYAFVFYASDNMVISRFLGTNALAFVNNYIMIITIVDNFITTFLTSLRDSLANYMHVEKDDRGLFETYRMTNILGYLVTSIVIVGLYVMFDRWISLWIGYQYQVDHAVKNLLVIILGIDLVFRPLENIYHIKGYRFVERLPLVASAVANIIISIILVQRMGLVGVYIGTIIGKFIYWGGKLYYVAGDAFNTYAKSLLIELGYMFSVLAVEIIVIEKLMDVLNLPCNTIFWFGGQCMIVVVCVCVINLVVFMRDEYFRRLVAMIYRTVTGLVKREA